jgi:hypothetical protein
VLRTLFTHQQLIHIQAGIVIFYIAISILVLHKLHKSNRRRYLVTFIVWDLLITGVCLAMISIYSFAGVPNNCGGMTRSNCKPIYLTSISVED